MDADLYIWLLAGVSIVGLLLYPAQSTWMASALTGVCEVNGAITNISTTVCSNSGGEIRNSFDMSVIANNIATYVTNNAAILITLGGIIVTGALASIFLGVSLSQFGLIALFQIVWRISVFFLIPNLLFLPNNLIGSSNLPDIVKMLIFAIFNIILLTIAVRYWE